MNVRNTRWGPGVRIATLLVVLIVGFLIGAIVERERVNPLVLTNQSWKGIIAQIFQQRKVAVDPTIFEKVWEAVRTEYVKQPVDERQLYYGAISGVVSILGDRYSAFLDPKDAEAFQRDLGETSFDGIGAEVGARESDIVIIAPLPDTPAQRAGIQAGDRLLQINDTPVMDLTVDQAVALIRGKRGTTVTLIIDRQGESKPLVFGVTREQIQVRSVRLRLQTSPKGRTVAIISITHFSEETSKLFQEATQQLLLKQPKAIILDVRNNPGGYLQASVDVAGEFLDPDSTVVIEKRVGKPDEIFRAAGSPLLKGIPTFVLVDGGSASAAEILAGALQDTRAGILIGTKTFGKGSVQQYDSFDDGSSLKLTVARWLTPKGSSIDGEGITPDIAVQADAPANAILDRAFTEVDALP